jgi:purine-binding chemotaxis protein CheW
MRDEQGPEEDRLQHQMKDFVQVVSFRLGSEEYAIEITKVKEIILVEGITRVPQMPDYIEGIINLRGNVIPVIDLRKRFGMRAREIDENTRIVVTRMENKIVGLIVDMVSQVMKIPHGDIQPPPETIAGMAGEYLTGIGRRDDRMIIMLDIEKILTAGEKAELASAATEAAPAG